MNRKIHVKNALYIFQKRAVHAVGCNHRLDG